MYCPLRLCLSACVSLSFRVCPGCSIPFCFVAYVCLSVPSVSICLFRLSESVFPRLYRLFHPFLFDLRYIDFCLSVPPVSICLFHLCVSVPSVCPTYSIPFFLAYDIKMSICPLCLCLSVCSVCLCVTVFLRLSLLFHPFLFGLRCLTFTF